ncbi:hypothetical protein PFISCL1PPCAC_22243, partial [Pristionchus fissidentatus]
FDDETFLKFSNALQFVDESILLFLGGSVTFSDKTWNTFSQWIHKSQAIHIYGLPIEERGIIDEAFVRTFVSPNDKFTKSLCCYTTQDVEKASFSASKDIIPSLARFGHFELISMIIKTEWIPDIIVEKCKTFCVFDSYMQFRVTSKLQQQHFLTLQNYIVPNTFTGRSAKLHVPHEIFEEVIVTIEMRKFGHLYFASITFE